MPSTPPLLAIVQHTPLWVWALLAALLALGVAQRLPRRAGLRRVALLPAAMLAWSGAGVAAGFASGVSTLAWALAAAGAALATAALGAPAAARWSARERAFDLPGSWVPLALIVALFGVKFVVGASLAIAPGLRNDASFVLGASLSYGAFSGIFAGRALALLRLARAQSRQQPV